VAGVRGSSNLKTAQGTLRHANITTTLNLYAKTASQEVPDAQGRFLTAMGGENSTSVTDCGLIADFSNSPDLHNGQ
jgi:hypothetical protein